MPKYLVMNITHLSGISKKTPFRPYDFTKIDAYATKTTKDDTFNGVKLMSLDCENGLFKAMPELPAICDITYEVEPNFNGEPKMVVKECKFVKKIELV